MLDEQALSQVTGMAPKQGRQSEGILSRSWVSCLQDLERINHCNVS